VRAPFRCGDIHLIDCTIDLLDTGRLLLRGIHYFGQDPIQKFGRRRLMQEERVLSPPSIGCQAH
jgi:hypothetical protein